MNSILVIDTGTSSMRGILFTGDGEALFSHSVLYTIQLGAGGEATMDAAVFRAALIEITAACVAYAKNAAIEVLAISFTSQRSSVAAFDIDGVPLSPFIMWYDKRSSALCAKHTKQHGAMLYKTSGMVLTPTSSAPKMQWLKDTYPDIYARAYKLMGIHDYLLLLVTDRFVTDTSLACRTSLMDIHDFCWSARLIKMFELDVDKLCELVSPGSIVGTVTAAFAKLSGLPQGIPVVSAGGDQQCCAFGQGLYQEGTININSGTASYISTILNNPLLDPQMQVNLSASCYGNRWIVEASNTGSGILYQWINKSFFTFDTDSGGNEKTNAAVMTVPAGCDGLLCVTDFAGRGCPDTDPDARGMFVNIDMSMGRPHFARAVLEGICFDIREACEYLSKLGISTDKLQSSGGMTKFPEFNTILTDTIGKDINVKSQSESTALGALIIAGIAIGQIDSPDAFFALNAHHTVTNYTFNPQRHTLYSRLYRQRLQIKAQISPSIFKN